MMQIKQSANPSGHGYRADTGAGGDKEEWQIESADGLDFMRIATANQEAGMDRVITVTSVNSVARRFLAGGGSIVRSKISIPGIGQMISCKDKVGQVFTFLEEECPVNPQRIHFG